MTYAGKIILHAPSPNSVALEEFVETCLKEKVALICIVGEHCELVENVIDELIVRDTSNSNRFITTSSHKNESIEDVVQFANTNAR